MCAHIPIISMLTHYVLHSVAFKMYDLDGDDKISRDELLAVLHMMVGANISEEQVITLHLLCCSSWIQLIVAVIMRTDVLLCV